MLRDGSLLVSDDMAGAIYRISYDGALRRRLRRWRRASAAARAGAALAPAALGPAGDAARRAAPGRRAVRRLPRQSTASPVHAGRAEHRRAERPATLAAQLQALPRRRARARDDDAWVAGGSATSRSPTLPPGTRRSRSRRRCRAVRCAAAPCFTSSSSAPRPAAGFRSGTRPGRAAGARGAEIRRRQRAPRPRSRFQPMAALDIAERRARSAGSALVRRRRCIPGRRVARSGIRRSLLFC